MFFLRFNNNYHETHFYKRDASKLGFFNALILIYSKIVPKKEQVIQL